MNTFIACFFVGVYFITEAFKHLITWLIVAPVLSILWVIMRIRCYFGKHDGFEYKSWDDNDVLTDHTHDCSICGLHRNLLEK